MVFATILYIALPRGGFDLLVILESLREYNADEFLLASLFILCGLHVDFAIRSARVSERKKNEIYYSTMGGVCHVVNNLLNGMKLVRLETAGNRPLSEETLRMLDETIVTAGRTIKEMSAPREIKVEAINEIAFRNLGELAKKAS
jgi:hypothetical protein